MTIPVFTGNAGTQCLYNAEHAPCEQVEGRLRLVEVPRCWVKNDANSFIECYYRLYETIVFNVNQPTFH